MYKIAICDEDLHIKEEIIQMLCQHHMASELYVTAVDSCEELCDMIMNGRYFDLIVLSVMSDSMNGIRLGRKLRSKLHNYTTQLLYISDESDCALQLFDLHPLNFIVMPVRQTKLYECLDDAMRLMRDCDGCLYFTVNHIDHMIPYRDIFFLESSNKRIIVHTKDGDLMFYGKLDEVCCPADFVRIHKSYLVNCGYVRRLKFDSLALDSTVELPISRAYRKNVRDNLFNAWQVDKNAAL